MIKRLSVLFLFMIMFAPHAAQAQLTLTRNQTMNFGEFAMIDINQVGTVTVSAQTGATTNNANILLFSSGQRGEYEVTGAPALTAYTVNIDNTLMTLNNTGTPPFLTLSAFQVWPVVLQTNGAGIDFFFVGATLSSDGGGQYYVDGNYGEDVEVMIQF